MPDFPSGTVPFLFADIEGSTVLWVMNGRCCESALRSLAFARRTRPLRDRSGCYPLTPRGSAMLCVRKLLIGHSPLRGWHDRHLPV